MTPGYPGTRNKARGFLPWPPHEPELDPPFDILEPDRISTPLVFSSPHSGNVYPQRFLASARLDAPTLRRSEDAFVDALFAGAAALGAPLLRVRFPRAYLDVNREPYELDPRMFDGRLPTFANTRSIRVAGGLGTIARVVGDSAGYLSGAPEGRGSSGANRKALQALSPVFARPARTGPPHVRLRGLDRLPLDAVGFEPALSRQPILPIRASKPISCSAIVSVRAATWSLSRPWTAS